MRKPGGSREDLLARPRMGIDFGSAADRGAPDAPWRPVDVPVGKGGSLVVDVLYVLLVVAVFAMLGVVVRGVERL